MDFDTTKYTKRSYPRKRRTWIWSLFCCLAAFLVISLFTGNSATHDFTVAQPRTCTETCFTVRINAWRRPLQLRRLVRRLATCGEVGRIDVVWTDLENAPPSPKSLLGYALPKSEAGRVLVERHTENSLNQRFSPLEPVHTHAVLSIDDDLMPTCDQLHYAFEAWKEHPHQMVGWYPRVGPGIWNRNYTLILTKGAFIHRKYLQLYWNDAIAPLRQNVKEWMNCEDILMAHVVGNSTIGLPAIWVDAGIPFEQTNGMGGGIHSDRGLQFFIDQRRNCFNEFKKWFPPGVLEKQSAMRYVPIEYDGPLSVPKEKTIHLSNWHRLSGYFWEHVSFAWDYIFLSRNRR